MVVDSYAIKTIKSSYKGNIYKNVVGLRKLC